jgi:hypothetical protein
MLKESADNDSSLSARGGSNDSKEHFKPRNRGWN